MNAVRNSAVTSADVPYAASTAVTTPVIIIIRANCSIAAVACVA
jgi:hypothetical protein